MYKHVKACVHREQAWQTGQAGQAGQAWQAGQAGQAGQAEQAGLTALFSTISFVETSKKTRKCTQRHPHKSFQKTNRNVQVLPNQKTHQNVETFEHKWQWFLTAPRHEKL
jgi:hypothetical protein